MSTTVELALSVYSINVRHGNLKDIEYRSSDGGKVQHVFRWDRAPYDVVFEKGFQSRRKADTPDATYYGLESYVSDGGRPLDSRKDTSHAFISTTMSSSWTPFVINTEILYRYEIYAPGGILVAQSLGDLYHHSAQDEVVFPAEIAPQYIRSAQRFELTNDSGNTRRKRVNDVLFANMWFNPQFHPNFTLRLRRPVFDYLDEDTGDRGPLTLQFVGRHGDRNADYYFSAERVGGIDHYIDSAFGSLGKDEAYIFIQGEYVLMNYAPGSSDDRIITGPHFIGRSFPSLVGTAFAEYGIDAALGCNDEYNEAIIFSGNLCAKIYYAPGTSEDYIMEGPKTIRQMFPFFRGTNFESGIDAGFESTIGAEAYLFKGSEYAHIIHDKRTLVAIRQITDGFPCLRDTEFERDIEAAFRSHVEGEAYLFKGNRYILLHFTPQDTGDYISVGPKDIVPSSWPSLKDILPRKNRGLDVYEYGKQIPDRDHDEL